MTNIIQTSQEALMIGNTIENYKHHHSNIPKHGITGFPTYPLLLLGIFVAWWIALAITPWSRQNWLLENILVFIVLLLLTWSYRHLRFSNFSYTLIFIFLCFHEIGAHYTYSDVPYSAWFNRLTGIDIDSIFGFERNHFDRLVHFLYGLLILPACAEIFRARGNLVGFWRYLVPITFVMAQSELFEMIEWQAVGVFGGSLGQAYLSAQGDIWDAQKDSAAAMIGAICSTLLCWSYVYLKKHKSSRIAIFQ